MDEVRDISDVNSAGNINSVDDESSMGGTNSMNDESNTNNTNSTDNFKELTIKSNHNKSAVLFELENEQIDYLREGFEKRQQAMAPQAARDLDAIYEKNQPLTNQLYIRSPYLSDVDRILNNPFFKRTFDKTQVFSLFKNDDLSRRGFHIQLVAQTAKKIGAALRLNTALIEAIGLGHDAGHTPFGHEGERFLNESYHARTGRYFNHNVHSVRALRNVAPCNLSLQTYNGILCHCGENNFSVYKPAECDSFDALNTLMEDCYTQDGYSSCLRPSTLEGCVVRICDILAYLGKDRQDAISAGYLDKDQYRFDSFLGTTNSEIIANSTINIIKNSIGKDCICMDEEVSDEIRRLKKSNFAAVYNYDSVTGSKLEKIIHPMMNEMYQRLLDDLKSGDESSTIFAHHINAWFIRLRNTSYLDSTPQDDIVCDFIASMTDNYFVELYRKLFPNDPKSKADLYVPYFD